MAALRGRLLASLTAVQSGECHPDQCIVCAGDMVRGQLSARQEQCALQRAVLGETQARRWHAAARCRKPRHEWAQTRGLCARHLP